MKVPERQMTESEFAWIAYSMVLRLLMIKFWHLNIWHNEKLSYNHNNYIGNVAKVVCGYFGDISFWKGDISSSSNLIPVAYQMPIGIFQISLISESISPRCMSTKVNVDEVQDRVLKVCRAFDRIIAEKVFH